MGLLMYIAFVLLSTVQASTFSEKSETKGTNDDIDLVNRPQYLPTQYIPSDLNSQENIDDDLLDSLKDDDEKRRMDRMMFHNSLGKRESGNDENPEAKRGRIDSFGFSGMLGKRGGLDRYGFVGSLGKRGGLDRYGFVGSLGKRGGLDRYGFVGSLGKRGGLDRYGFVGSLGKRRGVDRYGFIGNLGKRSGYDRYGFIGSLGKRRGMDRYSFIGSLGKRGRIDSYGFAGMLGKRDPQNDNQGLEDDKRSKLDRYSFFGKFGKRMNYAEDDVGRELDKRSVDQEQSDKPNTRRKRSTSYPWFLNRQQRYYPSKWLRGIDRFSFGTRLGKRAPYWRFFPQLGKRNYPLPYDSGMYLLELKEPRQKKTCLRGFCPGQTQTGPYIYRR